MRQLLCLLFGMLLLSACKQEETLYNGYIDADLIYLSSDFPGRLSELCVRRGEAVNLNQLLFKLEETGEQYNVSVSQYTEQSLLSQQKEILAQIHYQEINFQRALKMQKQHAASQNDVDLAKKDLAVLNNQRRSIDAQIKSSHISTKDKRWQLSRKEGYARESGIVFDTYFSANEFVQAGQPVLSLITPQHIKVIFYIPETALNQIRLNQKIAISSDSTHKLAIGTIRYISKIAQYTPPIIYSREERQNLVFRVEASIDSPDLNRIHLGQPVSLEVNS